MKNILLLVFFAISSPVFSQIDLQNGLMAYYPFNGNANDESGNNNNPVFNNATLTTDYAGNANSAYHFNGIDNYMQIPNAVSINPTNQISICAYIKPTGFYKGPCHGNSPLMKGDDDYLPGNYFLRFDDNSYTFQNNCNTSVVDTIHQNFYSNRALAPSPGYTPYINKNQWYCLIYTHDGTTASLYIDGTLIYSESAPGETFSNSYDLFFGRLKNPSFPYWFNGDLDEVRIYNRPLNAQEITTLCPGSLPVKLTKFETSIKDNQIKLDWNVELEDGIDSYTIERSISGNSNFKAIGTVRAKNAHFYSFIDISAAVNQNYYYRLAISENNKVTYSAIKSAKINGKNKLLVIYPNPSDGSIKIKMNGYEGKAKFIITNSIGQVVMQKDQVIYRNNPVQFLLNKQSKGLYWLKVNTDKGEFIATFSVF